MTLQYSLEHFAVGVAAVTGVLAARGKRVDLFGVIVLALVTAFGGGTIRDCTMGDFPVFWVEDPSFAWTATGAAVLTFYVEGSRQFPRLVLLVADAFALALFTMLGARKVLGFGAAPSLVVAMGVITGVAGGILRDLLVGEIPLVFRREIYLYATAAFCGAVLFVTLSRIVPDENTNMVIATATTLLLRLMGIRWKLSLPVFVSQEERGENDRARRP